MSLQQDSTHLALKILANVGIRNHANYLDDLQYTLLLALSKAYIKGRNHERDALPWEELEDGSVFVSAKIDG